jgi:hypothetical protein
MKKLFLIACVVISPLLQLSAQENAKIMIIRDTGPQSSISGYSTFLNDNCVEKIKDKTTVTFVVPAGEATLSFRNWGKNKPRQSEEKLTLDLKPEEIRYVMVVEQRDVFWPKIMPLEVTEATAEQYVQPLNFTVELPLQN